LSINILIRINNEGKAAHNTEWWCKSSYLTPPHTPNTLGASWGWKNGINRLGIWRRSWL